MSLKNWIWTSDPMDTSSPVVVLFRRAVWLEEVPARCKVRLSADSRYRFFVNGQSVCQGPVKGDRHIWYYDEADIAPYLQPGENVLAAIVLRYPQIHDNGNFSIWRTEHPGFFMEGDLEADDKFLCRIADGVKVSKANPYFEPLCISESVKGCAALHGWKMPGYTLGPLREEKELHVRALAHDVPGLLPPGIRLLQEKVGRHADAEHLSALHLVVSLPVL